MKPKHVVRVRDVMKPDFEMIDGMKTVRVALEAMSRRDIHCLIVEKRHHDDEHGLVLLSDIARKILAKDRSPDRVNVYEVMAKPFISVDADMDIRYCARLFDQFNITRAPVLHEGDVVGIVSFTDLVLRGMVDAEAAGQS